MGMVKPDLIQFALKNHNLLSMDFAPKNPLIERRAVIK